MVGGLCPGAADSPAPVLSGEPAAWGAGLVSGGENRTAFSLGTSVPTVCCLNVTCCLVLELPSASPTEWSSVWDDVLWWDLRGASLTALIGDLLLSVLTRVRRCSGLLLLALLCPLEGEASSAASSSALLLSDPGCLTDGDSDLGISESLWLFSKSSPLEGSTDGSFSVSGFVFPLLRLTFISKLNLKSPLFGLVRLTALQDWFPRCPLRVVFPVCRTELSQSIIESPFETSSADSAPVKKTGNYQN